MKTRIYAEIDITIILEDLPDADKLAAVKVLFENASYGMQKEIKSFITENC
jgi:hypothetical protein